MVRRVSSITAFTVLALCLAVAGAIFPGEPIHAQGIDNDYVDVGLTLEVPPHSEEASRQKIWINVVNQGARTAYDVEVVVSVESPALSHFHDGPVAHPETIEIVHVPIGRVSLENDERSLRWTIPAVEGGQRLEYLVGVVHFTSTAPGYDKSLYPHEFLGRVTTSSFESDHHKGNNDSRVWSYRHSRGGTYRQAAGNYSVAVSVDDPSPSPGETVNFTVTTDREPRKPGGDFAPPIDMEVAIELTGGLSVSGAPTYASGSEGGLTTPSSVSYSNGVFRVGTLKGGNVNLSPEPVSNSVTLPVAVASGAVVNEQCLTARLTGNPPPGTGPNDDDISDNVAKLCLGVPSQKKLYQSGTVGNRTMHACRSDVPAGECDTADEVDIQIVASTDDPSKLDLTPAVIHIKDEPGRVFDAHSGSVTNGTTVSWQTATDEDPDFTGTRNGVKVGWDQSQINDYLANWQHYNVTYTASGLNGGPPPGLVSVRSRISGTAFWALTPENSWTFKRATNYRLSSPSTAITIRLIEFEKLGTYVLDFTGDFLHATIDEDNDGNPDFFSGTGRTYFHVGPIADLGIADGGASPDVASDRNALTIVAINNIPDRSRGAQVTGLPKGAEVLRISQGRYDGPAGVWNIGELEHKDSLRAAGKPEGATLVLGASAGETVTAQIVYEPYLVCIGSDGSTLAHTSRAACEAVTGASWHEGTVYDYNAGDNTAVIAAARGTGSQTAASTTAVVGVVLDWEPADDVNGLPVTGYQIHRQEDPQQEDSWELLATVPASQTRYVDTAVTERPEPYMYRVRAVNEAGIPGPWLITIEGMVRSQVAAQYSEVSLTLTPATIGENTGNVAEVTATLVRASGENIEITVSAVPAAGSGTAPEDFSLSEDNTLTIPAGSLESRGNVVTITANDDGDSGDERITITGEATNARGNIRSLTLTIDDDDDPGLSLGLLNPAQVPECPGTAITCPTATYTVKLDARPSADVTIRIASSNPDVAVDTDTAEDGPQNTLTFTPDNWDTAQLVIVTAREDDDAGDDEFTLTHGVVDSASAAEYRPVQDTTLSGTVADKDTAVAVVHPEVLRLAEGKQVTYTIQLLTRPTGNVRINLASNNPSVTVSPASFDYYDYPLGRLITVTARQDDDSRQETAAITHTFDPERTGATEYLDVVLGNVTVTVMDDEAPTDYDFDDDGLLEITTREQLNAIRLDLDGNGKPDAGPMGNEAKDYARAFPRMMAGSCGSAFNAATSVEVSENNDPGTCTGYELLNDIALSGSWTPIPDFEARATEASATLEGNGHTISGLSISRPNDDQPVGMFTYNSGTIQNLGLAGVNVTGDSAVGALVGQNQRGGEITGVWVTGRVTGHAHTGGLVGFNLGTVERSYSAAAVAGVDKRDSGGPLWSVRVAGLVGLNRGTVENAYATGAVRGAGHVTGLVGWNDGSGEIINSYAAGSVTSTQGFPTTGGLVGWQTASVSRSYWDTEATGQKDGAGQGDPGGAKGLTTTEMQKLDADSTGWSDTYQVVEGDVTINFYVWDFGSDNDYPCLGGVTPGCVSVSITVTAADPVAVNEGDSAAYTVVLGEEPTGDVVVEMSSDNADVKTQPASLTFTPGNWQTAQTVTVSASQDADAADDMATIRHAASGADDYDGIAIASVNVAVTDDDTAGVTVSESSLSLEEGGSATYTVVLDTQPVSDVEIYPFSNVEGVTAAPAKLTFTSDNWHMPQTVTVSASQDDDPADEQGVISHSLGVTAGSAYGSVTIAPVFFSVTDDDADAQPAQAEPENATPVADAGADQWARTGSAVFLNGVGSSDPDGDLLTYAWTQVGGTTVALSDDAVANPTFIAPDHETTLVFELVVNDGTVDSAADQVAVAVYQPDPNRVALEAFYLATDGDKWTNSVNWLSDQPLDQWHGVTVNGQGQVTQLVLDGNNLSGSLPAELEKLTGLTRLALNRNQLTGAIPSQLGNLSNLSIIGLANNQLSGSLPAGLSSLPLTRLSLHDNTGLSGALPSGFTALTNLQRLAVASTGLCAPDDEAFKTWLDTVPDKPGGVPTCGE